MHEHNPKKKDIAHEIQCLFLGIGEGVTRRFIFRGGLVAIYSCSALFVWLPFDLFLKKLFLLIIFSSVMIMHLLEN